MVMALALIALSVAASPAEATYPGSISGTVTDAVTKAPIEGLQVCASPEDGFPARCGTTAADGRYTISDLQVDSYLVYFYGEPLGYEWHVYHDEFGRPAAYIEVGTGPVNGIDAELHPWGRIEGTVRKAGSGDPVQGIRVCAFALHQELLGICDKSAADGTYQLEEIKPGDYVIEFLTDWKTVSTQFYPDQEIWNEEDKVHVALSQVLTGIDADLKPASRLEGTVRRADDGSPLQGVRICARRVSFHNYFCTNSTADGTYAFVALPADQYLVEFDPQSPSLLTEFWDDQEEAQAAELLTVEGGTVLSGIDADIKAAPAPGGDNGGSPLTTPSAPEMGTSPLTTMPSAPSESTPVLRPPGIVRRDCPRGFRKVSTAGGERCVRRHHHRRRHGKSHVLAP
jgi:hypothetical protein